ncbi:MAG: DUF4315 family protein [Oscillospiraceae bacterium]|nr:DUF4315 family protein [Oscillospiraceae bacterium]
MEEARKRRYPANREKLYELRDKLDAEIAERQSALNDVRKLIREADNAAIINTARIYNVTPEEFAELVKQSRSGEPNPKKPAAKKPAAEPKEEPKNKTEETENE